MLETLSLQNMQSMSGENSSVSHMMKTEAHRFADRLVDLNRA